MSSFPTKPLVVSFVTVAVMTTSSSMAEEPGPPVAVSFPQIPAGKYGANGLDAEESIIVYADQTCTSHASGSGSIVTTMDKSVVMCLSSRGFTFYDTRKNQEFSSLKQKVEPGWYGERGLHPKSNIDTSINVISKRVCESQSSGPGLTIIVPVKTTGIRNRTIFCLSPVGKGYTYYDIPSGRGAASWREETKGFTADPTNIRYSVGWKIMGLLGSYLPDGSTAMRSPAKKRGI